MCSAFGSGDRPLEDLTARARIRDAALSQFAERGFAGATIKGIADAAGYSTGLVQHHYGTKAELRQACDAHVIDTLLEYVKRSLAGEAASPNFMAAMYEASGLSIRYLARALVDGSPSAAALFDDLTSFTEEFLTSSWPQRFPSGSARARDGASVMGAMHLGTIVLHEHLSRRMRADILARENSHRIGAAIGDIYAAMGEFLASDVGSQIHDAVAERQRADAKGEHDGD